MSNFVGTEMELLVSDLSSVRDVLMYGIYLREQSLDDKRNYHVNTLVGDIYPSLIVQWSKANALCKAPVINKKCTILKS